MSDQILDFGFAAESMFYTLFNGLAIQWLARQGMLPIPRGTHRKLQKILGARN